jgi:hypothetical protein
MKNLNLLLVTLLCVTTSFAQNNKGIISPLENVQSGIVGKTVVTYKKGQTLLGSLLPNITTKDEVSSSEDTKEFKKNFKLGIAKALKIYNLTEFKVDATNVKITTITNDVETLPTGSKIVMNGFKADSVTITMTKKSNYNLSLSDLLDKIKKFAPVSEASAINALSLIDSANYQTNKTIKIVIRNPNVFYSMIVGQIKSEYANNAYLDIPNALSGATKISLNTTSKRIRTKSSKEFSKTGFVRDILLSARTNAQGEPELYVQATKQDGGVDEIKVNKIGNNWNQTGILFKSVVLGKATKKYYVDISASLAPDGQSIIITSGEIRYPEWIFNAITTKKLEN